MSTPQTLYEHGIHTTTADYWVHLFPVEDVPSVYWYRVDHMREYLRLNKIPVTIGTSKDGAPTGAGYLVSRTAYFVSYAEVPKQFAFAFPWALMTDRECGFAGEHIIDVLVEKRVVTVPAFRLRCLRSRADQYDAKDFKGVYFGDLFFETKTERVKSRNLFVQSREGGHRVHLTSSGGGIAERFSEAPGFEEYGGL